MKALIGFLIIMVAPEFLPAQTAVVIGHIDNFPDSTITYSILPADVFTTQVKSTCSVYKGAFQMALQVSAPRFISIDDGHGNYIGALIEKGDSVTVSYDALHFEATLKWAGPGYEKQEMFRKISKVRLLGNSTRPRQFPVDTLFQSLDAAAQQIRGQLIAPMSRLSKEAKKLLAGYLETTLLRAKYSRLINLYGDSFERILRNDSFRLNLTQRTAIKNLLHFNDKLSYSVFYVNYLASLLDAYYQDNSTLLPSGKVLTKYQLLSQKIPSKLRGPVMYLLIERDIARQNVRLKQDIPQEIFTGDMRLYYNRLLEIISHSVALQKGIPAPSFQLNNERGELVTLESFSGKVIYIDFWFAACAPCHQLFKAIDPAKEVFRQDTNVVFLTVSVDDRETWQRALTKYQISGYHVFTQGKFRDHPIIRDYLVGEYPTAYLIDKDGKIVNNQPPKTSEALIAAINRLLQ